MFDLGTGCDKDGSVTATQHSACAGLAAVRSEALQEQENWGQDKTLYFNHSCDAVLGENTCMGISGHIKDRN